MKNLSRVAIFLFLFIFAQTVVAEKIDINTASLGELQKIIGVGPVIAQRIIEARPFHSLDELTRVRGIGPKTLEKIKNQGLAGVDPRFLKKTESPKTEVKDSPKEEITNPKRELAAIGEQAPKSFLPFLVAFSIAIFSGIIILILKKKVKNLDLSRKLE